MRVLLLALSLIQGVSICSAQLDPTRAYGTEDQSISLPQPTGTLGRQDVGAVNEIQAHLSAAGVNGWQDLQLSGSLSFPDGVAHSFNVWFLGSTDSRMDVQMDAGVRSTRIQSGYGDFRDENGNDNQLSLNSASVGICALPLVWSSGFLAPTNSLVDRGLVSVGSSVLHRISLEMPSSTGTPEERSDIAIDLYFDPNSHQLVKSADLLIDPANPQAPLLRVTTYSNYQAIGNVSQPTSYWQTLNGQLQWVFQVNQSLANSGLSPNIFSF